MFHRSVLYSVLTFLLLVQAAFAQEAVGVRTGEHKDYSRLVFDWNQPVKYSIDKDQPGLLVLKFENKASIKNTDALNTAMRNYSAVRVIESDPLTVSLNIPEDSRTRSFLVGRRLVLDVYNSPSGKTPAAAKEPVPALEKPPELENQQIELKSAEAEVEEPAAATGDVNAEPPPEELSAPENAKPHAPKIEKSIDKKATISSNLIAFTATKSFGLAAFQINNNLWIISDQSELNLKPQVSGPDAEYLEPITATEIPRGKAFKTKMLPMANVRGEGGGLLWRVIVSKSPFKGVSKAITPERKGVREGQSRSGYIIFPFKTAQKILEVTDPITGATIKVVSVDNPNDFSGQSMDFVDFKVLPSAIGLAILPKVDDLQVEITEQGVKISRPGGLAITSQDQAQAALSRKQTRKNQNTAMRSNAPNIFNFKNWELGGLKALEENTNVILTGLNDLPEGKKIEDIITLAKMYLANGLAPEALGFLKFAQNLLPGVEASPEFRALNAAAYALVTKSESAFLDLSRKDLKPYGDIAYWRAFTLADLGDWQQAAEILPADLSPIQDYPKYIYNRIAPGLAEVALRSGNVTGAEQLLKRLDSQDDLWEPQKAALSYLKGEAERQKGNLEQTKKIWEELASGKDNLYRARAGLALTSLKMETGEIKPEEAIDNLERLRYAWRGDELEAQINYKLGKTYFENAEYGRGLNILREAAGYAVGTPLSRRITSEMSDVFAELFLTDKLSDVSPVDATALYEQFTELVPSGAQGDVVVERLAERLVQADLLDRAADLLEHQIEHRLKGREAHRVATRLAAIKLINNEPFEAVEVLKKASQFLQSLPAEFQTPERLREISLLRARALSKQGRPDQALNVLNDLETNPDVNRLKADIAWNAGYWDDAGEALDDVIFDMNISMTRPLNEKGMQVILQRAVALNLAGDRIALANMREKYSDLMAQTEKSKVFEVITRARQSAALADRQTLLNVAAETDLFADFLNSYRTKPPESN